MFIRLEPPVVHSAVGVGSNACATEEGVDLCEMLGNGLGQAHRHDLEGSREGGQRILDRTTAGQNGERMEIRQVRSSALQTDWHVHHQGVRGDLSNARRSYRRHSIDVLLTVQEGIRGAHCGLGEQIEDHARSTRRMARLPTLVAGSSLRTPSSLTLRLSFV